MKKLLRISLILVAVTCMFAACSDDDDDVYENIIEASSLPQLSKVFISQHFGGETITLAKELYVPNYATGAKYYVYLTNGYEVSFDKIGNWITVGSDATKLLPTTVIALLPSPVPTYISTNYPGAIIAEMMKLTVGTNQYRVKLNNGMTLKFNAEGEFISAEK